MRKIAIALGLLVLVLSGCSDDGSEGASEPADAGDIVEFAESLPECSEWTERDVTAEDVENGCKDGNSLQSVAVYDCQDGRTQYWNDSVWGYVGEPATAHEAGAQKVAPEAERDKCNNG